MLDDIPTGRRAVEQTAASSRELGEVQSAELELIAGPIQLRLRARVTPVGLLALGVVLSGVVASSSAVVWAARRRRRLE